MTEEVLSSEEVTAQHLKFIIKSGYDHFVGVFAVEVMGSLASGRSPSRMIRKAHSAMPAKKAVTDDNDEVHLDEDEEVEGNNKRRRRFQSAFRVPTSNRTSQDHSHVHEMNASLNNQDAAFYGDDSIVDDDEDDEDDTYMKRHYWAMMSILCISFHLQSFDQGVSPSSSAVAAFTIIFWVKRIVWNQRAHERRGWLTATQLS